MNVFAETLDGFHDFAVNTVAGVIDFTRRNSVEPEPSAIALPPERSIVTEVPEVPTERTKAVPVPETFPVADVPEVPTFRSTADIIETEMKEEAGVRPEKNTVMYVGSMDAPLYQHPTVQFDGVTARLPYGAMVMVLAQKGRWSNVVYETYTGWIMRDDLIDRAAHVYPHFTIGEQNRADDPNTIRVRAIIDDAFAAGLAALPLQASEYVTFRLQRKGIRLVWPETRPRTEGTWHTLLKGIPGIHMSIQPKTGTIIEYTEEDGTGRLGFVEAVFPDDTIHISETNYPDGGIYNERVLTKEEWKELKPVFIHVS